MFSDIVRFEVRYHFFLQSFAYSSSGKKNILCIESFLDVFNWYAYRIKDKIEHIIQNLSVIPEVCVDFTKDVLDIQITFVEMFLKSILK